jgi:hypothetical protein
MMSRSSGLSAPIAVFRLSPRPASAVPKPTVLVVIASRVGSSKVSTSSSNSTCAGLEADSGMVSPSA